MNILSLHSSEEERRPQVGFFVCCLVDSQWQAVNIAGRLQPAVDAGADISVLFASRALMEIETSPAVSLLDRTLGGLSKRDWPGLGLFLGAGRIVEIFRDRDQFRIDDDVARRLRAFGIPRSRCANLARRLVQGEILLALDSAELNHAIHAEDVFQSTGVTDVVVSSSMPERVADAAPILAF